MEVIPGGFHCSDLYMTSYAANDGVKKVVDNAAAHIKTWIEEYNE